MENQQLFKKVCPSGSVPYIIRKGDTLNKIAVLYNSSVSDIMNTNPNINPSNLIIGDQICVPLTKQLYPICPTTNYYVVKEEDTFDSIADYFNVTIEQLYYSNFGIDINSLYVDQILCIPVAPPPVYLIINTNTRELNVFKNGNRMKFYPVFSVNPKILIPKGNFLILNKQVDPGVELGARYLGLSKAGLGIHGTNTPEFIDKLVTESSIVLSNKDISELFNLVSVGTNVSIL